MGVKAQSLGQGSCEEYMYTYNIHIFFFIIALKMESRTDGSFIIIQSDPI